MIKNKKEKTNLLYGALIFCQIFNLLLSSVKYIFAVVRVLKLKCNNRHCKLNKVQKTLFYNFS